MTETFAIHLILSFLVGGVWITLATVTADRFGSKIGGLFIGLPSTVAVTLIFIGISQGRLVASDATTVLPLAYAVNGPFLVLYAMLIRHGILRALAVSLICWFVLSSIIIGYDLQNFVLSIAVWLSSFAGAFAVMEKRLKIPSRSRLPIRHSGRQTLARALFSGSVISFAVYMTKVGGPIYGGVFASFPAAFLSSLVITYLSGGADFSRAAAKSMMFSGFINVVGFAVAVRYLYQRYDLLAGTLGALAFSVLTGILTLIVMRKRLS